MKKEMKNEFLNVEVLENAEAPSDLSFYGGIAAGTVVGGAIGYGVTVLVLT